MLNLIFFMLFLMFLYCFFVWKKLIIVILMCLISFLWRKNALSILVLGINFRLLMTCILMCYFNVMIIEISCTLVT